MHSTESDLVNTKATVLAQISDSHLFSSIYGQHHGYNVLTNLKKVLSSINDNPAIDYIVFTGDLTQDHSEQSYQNFVDCVHECRVSVPIFYLAGNHDEPSLLAKYFSVTPFQSDKAINTRHWQVQLIDSKSETPAGYVSKKVLENLESNIEVDKHQLVMMHHHPMDVGYFIDKHGLQNKVDLWQTLNSYDNIKAIACGHIHRAMQLTYALDPPLATPLNKPLREPLKGQLNQQEITQHSAKAITLYTCPATSIQFDPKVDGVAALAKGPGYRIFHLYADGEIATDIVYP